MKKKKYTQKEQINQLEVVFAKLFLALSEQAKEIRKIQGKLEMEFKKVEDVSEED